MCQLPVNIFCYLAIYDSQPEAREAKQIEFVNSASDEKDTPLHVAAQAGYIETVKTLVSVGANVNIRTDTKATALHLAAISGQTAVVRYLVSSANAKVNVNDEDQMTPLHKYVKLFIKSLFCTLSDNS